MESTVDGWTVAKFKAFIVSTLRSGMRRFPNKSKAIKNAAVGKKINENSGRMAEHYECNKCKRHFPRTEIQCDHTDPVIDPKVGFVSWDSFIERMFCRVEDLQVLCKHCHTKKTKKEIAVRVKTRSAVIKPRNPGKRKKAYTKHFNNSEKCV